MSSVEANLPNISKIDALPGQVKSSFDISRVSRELPLSVVQKLRVSQGWEELKEQLPPLAYWKVRLLVG